MQGQETLVTNMAQAALVVDLHLAGVKVECGEVPFEWLALAAVGTSDLRGTSGEPRLGSLREGERLPAVAEVKAEVVKPPVVAAVAEGRVWRVGEEVGGVVVVLQGDKPLAGDALVLLQRMLAAVGLGPEVVWVGALGKVAQEAVVAEIMVVKPLKVLVLGQGMLGVLLGKIQGVEGWQVAPTPLKGLEEVRVGVTYPPELLLGQPLFKRLSWQHLMAWRDW